MHKKLIIGTRGSELALWQAKFTQALLQKQNVESELKIIVTSGDKNQSWQNNFDKLEGKNFFTKEIEGALLNKEIDLAVHSFKDVATEEHSELIIAGYSQRHRPNDLMIIKKSHVDESQYLSIKQGAKVGTSSARRYCQLKALRPDVHIIPLRGNVPTRLNKLNSESYDAIILAAAGIERLQIDLAEYYIQPLPLHFFTPAAGQGIIAWQCRKDDTATTQIIHQISNEESTQLVKTERQITSFIGAGCSKPVGVTCIKHENDFQLYLSYSTDKEKTPALITIQGNNKDILAQNAIHLFQNINKQKKVLITKRLHSNSYLKKLTDYNLDITDISFIQTSAIENTTRLPNCNWIFFNSRNAVKYFFESGYKITNQQVACVGAQTALELGKHHTNIDFIGVSNDIEKIAEAFIPLCKNQIVLFPSSTTSLRSIGSFIQMYCNIIHFPIYQTVEQHHTLHKHFDSIIFTSPSNVRGFMHNNKISDNTKCIAIGLSTKAELVKQGLKEENIYLPIAFDEVAIAGVIFSL